MIEVGGEVYWTVNDLAEAMEVPTMHVFYLARKGDIPKVQMPEGDSRVLFTDANVKLYLRERFSPDARSEIDPEQRRRMASRKRLRKRPFDGVGGQ